MGLTYKEDVPDTRESQVREMAKELEEYKVEIFGFDPLVDIDKAVKEFRNIRIYQNLEEIKMLKVDAIILTVAHSFFRDLSFDDFKELQHDNPILIDVRGLLDAGLAEEAGFYYKTL